MSMDLSSSLSFSQIVPRVANTVTSCLILFMETAAQLSLGQTIFRLIDRFLWVIEKSAQWSLPAQETVAEENGNTFGKVELVRPLPWIFFLAVLMLLRMFRIGLNIGSMILGYQSIEPAAMVKFLQKIRKRLRGIKSNGMKNMRQRICCEKNPVVVGVQNDNVNDANSKLAQLLRTLHITLNGLFCLDGSKLSASPPPTRIKVHTNHDSTPTPEERSTTESAMQEESKRKYSEVSSEDQQSEDSEAETVQTKIDRLAVTNDSMDDDDFNPDDLSSLEDDSRSTSGDSNISITELRDIRNEANLILHRALAGVTDVIDENTEQSNEPFAQSTDTDGMFDNSKASYTEENDEVFCSPSKLGDEGETAFYSPISSTSPSPDRMVPMVKQEQQDRPIDQTRMDLYQNGEPNSNAQTQLSDSTDKTPNGHSDEKPSVPANAPTRTVKAHHRGRRASGHVSRKKK